MMMLYYTLFFYYTNSFCCNPRGNTAVFLHGHLLRGRMMM